MFSLLLSHLLAVHNNTHRTVQFVSVVYSKTIYYEGWNFNSGNYLFTTDTK